jgi:hypothetical protein
MASLDSANMVFLVNSISSYSHCLGRLEVPAQPVPVLRRINK